MLLWMIDILAFCCEMEVWVFSWIHALKGPFFSLHPVRYRFLRFRSVEVFFFASRPFANTPSFFFLSIYRTQLEEGCVAFPPPPPSFPPLPHPTPPTHPLHCCPQSSSILTADRVCCCCVCILVFFGARAIFRAIEQAWKKSHPNVCCPRPLGLLLLIFFSGRREGGGRRGQGTKLPFTGIVVLLELHSFPWFCLYLFLVTRIQSIIQL